jgi:peptide/nickel transport system permease protein
MRLGQSSDYDEQTYQQERAILGLDQPLTTQYLLWLGRALHGDLGRSTGDDVPVLIEITAHFPATLELAVAGILVSLLMAIPAGILSASKHNSWIDAAISTFSTLGTSTPIFLVGILLISFLAVDLRLFKPDGYVALNEDFWGNLYRLVLPALTLGLILAAMNIRLVRATVLDVIDEDYVRTAYAKGLKSWLVLHRHVLRNALIPLVTLFGLQFAALLEGVVITETLFSWPGIGQLMISSVNSRDYPLIQGIVLFSAVIYILINLAVDLSYAYLDPRIHYA